MSTKMAGPGPGLRIGACIVFFFFLHSSLAAPIENNEEGQTQVQEFLGQEVEPTGCYYNYQQYDEGDRIITNEPCLNCTCHNRMLMCYLRVCPFSKAIGQDCTIEKRADQCCPVITCPEVPVQLLTSSTTESSDTQIAQTETSVGHVDDFGCKINDLFYTDGAQVPGNPYKPCELCYCIRNRTACVMQECTLRVEGCRPIYEDGVCCPVKYDCDYEEVPRTTTTEAPRPTPGLVLTTTTGGPQDCRHDGHVYADGASIETSGPCEHCYCMRGEIVCAVQECGTPLDKQNCTALPPPEGACCPETYHCESDDIDLEATRRQDRKHNDVNITMDVGTTEPETEAMVSEINPRPVKTDQESATEKPLHINEIPNEVDQEHVPVTDRIGSDEKIATVSAIEMTTVHPPVEVSSENPEVTEKSAEITTKIPLFESGSEHTDASQEHVSEVSTEPSAKVTEQPFEGTSEHEVPHEEHKVTEPAQEVTEKAIEEPKGSSAPAQPTVFEIEASSTESGKELEEKHQTVSPISSENPETGNEEANAEEHTERIVDEVPEKTEKPSENVSQETASPATESHSHGAHVENDDVTSEQEDHILEEHVQVTESSMVSQDSSEITEGPEAVSSNSEIHSKPTEGPVYQEEVHTSTEPHLPKIPEYITESSPEYHTIHSDNLVTEKPESTESDTTERINLVDNQEKEVPTELPVEQDSQEPEKMVTPESHSEEVVTEGKAPETDKAGSEAHSPAPTVHSDDQETPEEHGFEHPVENEEHSKVNIATTVQTMVESSEPISEGQTKPEKLQPEVAVTTEESEHSEPEVTEVQTEISAETTPNSEVESHEESLTNQQEPVQEVTEHQSVQEEVTQAPVKGTSGEEINYQEENPTTQRGYSFEEEIEGTATEKQSELETSSVTESVAHEETSKNTEVPAANDEIQQSTEAAAHQEGEKVTEAPVSNEEIQHVTEGAANEEVEKNTEVPVSHDEVQQVTEVNANDQKVTEVPDSNEGDQKVTEITVEEEIQKTTEGPVIHEVTAHEEVEKATEVPVTHDEAQQVTEVPEVVAHFEPTRAPIPGEGSCLVDKETYANNSAIPPASKCQTSCRCISSIVHCTLVNCPPPPPGMKVCAPHYKENDCCPSYLCDGEMQSPLESSSHVTEQPTNQHELETEKNVEPTEAAEPANSSPVEHVTDHEVSMNEVEQAVEHDMTEQGPVTEHFPEVSNEIHPEEYQTEEPVAATESSEKKISEATEAVKVPEKEEDASNEIEEVPATEKPTEHEQTETATKATEEIITTVRSEVAEEVTESKITSAPEYVPTASETENEIHHDDILSGQNENTESQEVAEKVTEASVPAENTEATQKKPSEIATEINNGANSPTHAPDETNMENSETTELPSQPTEGTVEADKTETEQPIKQGEVQATETPQDEIVPTNVPVKNVENHVSESAEEATSTPEVTETNGENNEESVEHSEPTEVPAVPESTEKSVESVHGQQTEKTADQDQFETTQKSVQPESQTENSGSVQENEGTEKVIEADDQKTELPMYMPEIITTEKYLEGGAHEVIVKPQEHEIESTEKPESSSQEQTEVPEHGFESTEKSVDNFSNEQTEQPEEHGFESTEKSAEPQEDVIATTEKSFDFESQKQTEYPEVQNSEKVASTEKTVEMSEHSEEPVHEPETGSTDTSIEPEIVEPTEKSVVPEIQEATEQPTPQQTESPLPEEVQQPHKEHVPEHDEQISTELPESHNSEENEPQSTEQAIENEENQSTEKPSGETYPEQHSEVTEQPEIEENQSTELPSVSEEIHSEEQPSGHDENQSTELPSVSEENQTEEQPSEQEESHSTEQPIEHDDTESTERPSESEEAVPEQPIEHDETEYTERPSESEEAVPEQPSENEETQATEQPSKETSATQAPVEQENIHQTDDELASAEHPPIDNNIVEMEEHLTDLPSAEVLPTEHSLESASLEKESERPSKPTELPNEETHGDTPEEPSETEVTERINLEDIVTQKVETVEPVHETSVEVTESPEYQEVTTHRTSSEGSKYEETPIDASSVRPEPESSSEVTEGPTESKPSSEVPEENNYEPQPTTSRYLEEDIATEAVGNEAGHEEVTGEEQHEGGASTELAQSEINEHDESVPTEPTVSHEEHQEVVTEANEEEHHTSEHVLEETEEGSGGEPEVSSEPTVIINEDNETHEGEVTTQRTIYDESSEEAINEIPESGSQITEQPEAQIPEEHSTEGAKEVNPEASLPTESPSVHPENPEEITSAPEHHASEVPDEVTSHKEHVPESPEVITNAPEHVPEVTDAPEHQASEEITNSPENQVSEEITNAPEYQATEEPEKHIPETSQEVTSEPEHEAPESPEEITNAPEHHIPATSEEVTSAPEHHAPEESGFTNTPVQHIPETSEENTTPFHHVEEITVAPGHVPETTQEVSSEEPGSPKEPEITQAPIESHPVTEQVQVTERVELPQEVSSVPTTAVPSTTTTTTTLAPPTTTTTTTKKPYEYPKPSKPDTDEYDNIDEEKPGQEYLPTDDYDQEEEEQPYGPGTCRYAGKVYVSAQQIPRDDPCDFCFCFRSDIICLQQSCPPPIQGCHEEPISGFCCPRYECHVRMATMMNVTSTTTTTTTTLPPHFLSHAYKGAAARQGCLVQGRAYSVGQTIASASGPCMDCICGGDGSMKCEPKVCTPEPMIRQMMVNKETAMKHR